MWINHSSSPPHNRVNNALTIITEKDNLKWGYGGLGTITMFICQSCKINYAPI